MKRLCSICVRGGSKGVKDKNLRPLLGKPLLVYSIEQALESRLFDTIAVSSDSAVLLEIARAAGATVLVERPPALASDTSAKIAAIRHCFQSVEAQLAVTFDTLVDLDATSPLRSIGDISAALNILESDSKVANVITAMPARRSPYFNMVERAQDGSVRLCKPPAREVARRQESPACYDMNASIYVWRREVLLSSDSLFHPTTQLYVMPEERSWDIDSELDFSIVELLMKKHLPEPV